MPVVALFGIENDGLNMAVTLLVFFLLVLYLALVFWTYTDAKRRIADPLIVACAVGASMFAFIGTIVYLILRPPEYLDDVRERELEIAASEARLLQMHEQACPYCSYPAERSFLRCPNCLKRLKEPCPTCRKPLDPRWKICPYCEAEIRRGTSQRRRRPAAGEPAAEGARPAARAGSERQPARTAAPRAGAAQADEGDSSRHAGAATRPPQPRPADVRPPQRPTEAHRPQRGLLEQQPPSPGGTAAGADDTTPAGRPRG